MYQIRKIISPLTCLVILSGLTACGGGSDGGGAPTPPPVSLSCAATSVGSLQVNINDSLAPGLSPAVTVFGPNNYFFTVTTSGTTLTNLDPGTYTFTASPMAAATGSDNIVRKAYSATMSNPQVCVGNGSTVTVTATYSLIATSNQLWIGSQNSGSNNTVSYSSLSVSASTPTGTTTAATTTNTTIGDRITFDGNGNMWVLGGTTIDPLVARYPAASFGGSGSKAADFSIPRTALPDATPISYGLTFDLSGNLWISSPGNGAVYRFKAKADGTVESSPSVTISGLTYPTGLAFANDNTLWVGDTGPNTLNRYSVSGAAYGTTITTALITTSPGKDVEGIAFDSGNNLWIVAFTQGEVYRLTSALLYTGGSVTPDRVFSAGSLPMAVAVDESDNLWVSGNGGNILVFDSAGATGASPIRVITTNTAEMNYGNSVAFYPAQAGLPLAYSLP